MRGAIQGASIGVRTEVVIGVRAGRIEILFGPIRLHVQPDHDCTRDKVMQGPILFALDAHKGIQDQPAQGWKPCKRRRRSKLF